MVRAKFPVTNCEECGKPFSRISRDICPDCYEKDFQDFSKVLMYLKDNPDTPVTRIADILSIPEKKVIRFLRSGQLRRYNVTTIYPCRICGMKIKRGIICLWCADEIEKHIVGLRENMWGLAQLDGSNLSGLKAEKIEDINPGNDLFSLKKFQSGKKGQKKRRKVGSDFG